MANPWDAYMAPEPSAGTAAKDPWERPIDDKGAAPLPGARAQPHSMTASDEDLGIADPPLLGVGSHNRYPSYPRDYVSPTHVHEQTELEGDPLLQAITGTAMAAPLAAAAGAGAGALAPALAPIVSGATGGAAATAMQGGDAKQVILGAGLGGLFGAPGAARALAEGAPEAVASRMQTDITGGARGKTAKQVLGARGILDETLDAHPDLKKTLSTSSDVATKASAVSRKLAELTDQNDEVAEAIAKHHGRISLAFPTSRLEALAQAAKESGDLSLRDAAQGVAKDLTEVADSTVPLKPGKGGGVGTVTADQLRGVRNGIANRIASASPGLPPSVAMQAASRIRATLNEAIADLAGETPGVDVPALRARNRQIASLLPVKDSLAEQLRAQGLKPPPDLAADLIEHPKATIAHAVRSLPAKADYAMSTPAAQKLFGNLPGATPTSKAAATAAASTAAKGDSFAARVADAMKNGLSLQAALKVAEAQQ